MTFIIPTPVFVVWFARDGIFRAFIPLGAAWLLLFMAQHTLKDKLIVYWSPYRIILMNLWKACVSFNLHLDTTHYIRSSASFFHYVLNYATNPSIALYIFICTTFDSCAEILHVFLVEPRIAWQVDAEYGTCSSQNISHLVDYSCAETRTCQV